MFKRHADISLLKFVINILSINELEVDSLVGKVIVEIYPADKCRENNLL